jgi:hypothetical protein
MDRTAARIMLIEDIAHDLEPDGSASTAAAAPARARPYACHHAKIDKVVVALEAEGLLPPELRPVVRNRRIIDALMADGFALDLPSRWAIGRYFQRRRR